MVSIMSKQVCLATLDLHRVMTSRLSGGLFALGGCLNTFTALRGRGIAWAFCGSINSLTNGYQSPNSVVPDIVTHFSGYFGPRSHHTGGAQVGRADGSVGFLSSSTDQSICQALHSCNGGEIASEN